MTERSGRRDPRPMAGRPPESGPRRLSPGIVFLAIAVVGSALYVGYAITVRDASQIPLLASGALVLAIAFGALAIYCLRATWQAGVDARGGRALLLAVVGGGAAIAACAGLAGAIILFLTAGTAPS